MKQKELMLAFKRKNIILSRQSRGFSATAERICISQSSICFSFFH